jgi:RNA polymerase sigma-70 factor, ECF subfamily
MSSFLNPEAGFTEQAYSQRDPSEVTDGQLLALVAGGHEPAFTELYQRYSVDLFNFLYRLIGQQKAAEDLLQEVFVAVWQNADRFKGQAKVKTWILRIGHNMAMSWLRRDYQQLHGRSAVPLEAGNDQTADLLDQQRHEGPTLEELTDMNWQAHTLRQALDDLSADHRAVVELFYLHELSYAEIAEVVGCPLGTVKSRMSHALARLNGILGQKEIGL